MAVFKKLFLFQSTRPLRGGTRSLLVDSRWRINFNPPAPCGAGPTQARGHRPHKLFQSTRPLRGGTALQAAPGKRWEFQSTRPLRGGTRRAGCCHRAEPFQSNRPLRGGTFADFTMESPNRFQSTRPLRGGTKSLEKLFTDSLFQSTRPLRGGTAILHKKTVQNIAYCTKSAFTLAVLSGFLALMRPFFCQTCTNFGANLPKNRCSLPVRTLIPSGPPPADSRH